MIRVTIANNINTYIMGKSDGLIFKDVSKEDINLLKELAERYNKQIRVSEVLEPTCFVDNIESTSDESDNEEVVTDKRKIKKIFITNGKETIKITPDKLTEYLSKGYRPGRK